MSRGIFLTVILAAAPLTVGGARAEEAPGAAQLKAAAFDSPSVRQRSETAHPSGVAQTSIERRFAHDRASGAVGFLCGREADHGGASPFGDDPHGRFLGARLAFALR